MGAPGQSLALKQVHGDQILVLDSVPTQTEDIPGYKKKFGGLAYTKAGHIFVSKGTRWRRAIFWHEKGHCLLFESGRVLMPNHSSLEEEILADEVADVMAGTYQTLGMLTMVLRRAKGRNVARTKRRIDAVCKRHPEESKKILNKLNQKGNNNANPECK